MHILVRRVIYKEELNLAQSFYSYGI